MSSPLRCSVVMPTFNRAHTLPRAVASVLAQDEPRLELIVVDDASTDGTALWLRGLEDPRVRVITLPGNGGPAEARNHGLRAARAPFTAFLDSDDVYRSNRLSVPLAALDADADLVCTISSSVKEVRQRTREVLQPHVKLSGPQFEWAMLCDLVGVETSSMTVRTEAALDCGGFSSRLRLTEDREFMMRLAKHGSLRMLPDVLWEKSWTVESLSNSWLNAGPNYVMLVRVRPEYVTRFPTLGNYFALRILASDMRHRSPRAFLRDFAEFRKAGLLRGGLLSLARKHKEVREYRRAMSRPESLVTVAGPPPLWC